MIETTRLKIIPGNLPQAQAEIVDRAEFARLLNGQLATGDFGRSVVVAF